MASCITPQWSGSVCPQIQLTIEGTNLNSTIYRLSWTLQYVGHGYPPHTYGARSYSVIIDGQVVYTGTYDINGLTGTYTIANGTKDITRDYSNRNVSFSLSFDFSLTWSGIWAGVQSASGSIAIPARTASVYSFDANGGSNAPESITKWGGVDFTFPTTIPTRTGYSFTGWNNSSISNGALYQPGQTVGGLPDQSIVWYANWKANTYTVSYDANGGNNAPGSQTKTYGVTLRLSSAKPTRTNYVFKGWGTSAGATTVVYTAGANYMANASVTLYAIWELDYTEPKITSVSVDRCDSEGTLTDEGTYAKVEFEWSIDSSATLLSVRIGYRLSGSANYTYVSVSASGKNGVVSKVIGGAFSTENSYDIRITVTDLKGSSFAVRTLNPLDYIMDFSPEGGIAFGGPADDDNNANFYNQVIFRDNLIIGYDSNLSLSDNEGTYHTFLKKTTYGTPLISSHIILDNTYWLQGLLNDGSAAVDILRINENNQIELNWTSGGLKGRVMKQLWSGTLSTGGSITVSALPYYHTFIGVRDDGHAVFGFMNPNRSILRMGADVIDGTAGIRDICELAVTSSTKLKLTRFMSTNYNGTWTATRQLKYLFGFI